MRLIGAICAATLFCIPLFGCSRTSGMLPNSSNETARTANGWQRGLPPANKMAAYKYRVIAAFTGVNGLSPLDNLTPDASGNLYGTTSRGFERQGTIFKISPAGKLQTLYNFNTNLTEPGADVVLDSHGNMFGTAMTGASSEYADGGIYEVSSKQVEKILHVFSGGADGDLPFSNLILDAKGDLYGTTSLGGTFTGVCGLSGCGVVFEITSKGKYNVIHSFSGTDGNEPNSGVIMDSKGNLYGTTLFGGNGPSGGYGTVYSIDPSGKERVIYNFTNGQDGGEPAAGVIVDAQGNFYGTATTGGKNLQPCRFGPSVGCGTIYKVDSSGHETTLHEFSSDPDGAQPYGGLILDSHGNLFGTAREGGRSQYYGVIFEIATSGKGYAILHSLAFKDGTSPQGSLYMDSAGNLYGTTTQSGGGDGGTAFELSPKGNRPR